MADTLYTLNHHLPEEFKRLEQNHWNLFLPLQGGKAIPEHIEEYLKSVPSPRVADIGTGTGVFLRSMAKLLPKSAQLDGFDPDTTKFPDPSLLDHNVKLREGNALESFPPDMLGTYDLVHLRLQYFNWNREGWPVAMKNAVDLLKPGGWLLWHEGGYGGWTTIPPSLAFDEYLSHEMDRTLKMGRDPLAAFKLKTWFIEAGLHNVDERVFNILQDEKLHKIGADALYSVCYQNALGILEKGDCEGLATRGYVDDLFKRIKDDFDKSLVGHQFRWVWGQKPGGCSGGQGSILSHLRSLACM